MEIAENVTAHLREDIQSSGLIYLCLDESTDITGSARLPIFIWYCVGNKIKEELISLTSLAITTK